MSDIPHCTGCGEYPGDLVADRIKELQAQRNFAQRQVVFAEAKLAKAMEHVAEYSNDPHLWKWAYATLEELSSVSCANSKGEK